MDYDVRDKSLQIRKIIFSDEDSTDLKSKAYYISRCTIKTGIWIGSYGYSVKILNEDIDNLILALQKAKELEWDKQPGTIDIRR